MSSHGRAGQSFRKSYGSSGVDAAAAVLALHHNKIPAALNTRKPIDGLKLNVKPDARDADVKVSVSSVYSLGGQNAALVFKKVS